MKPYIRYGKNGFRLYPPRTLRGEAATAFLRFSADYFSALAKRYGEQAHLEVDGNRLLADLSQAPRTLQAARRLEQKRTPQRKGRSPEGKEGRKGHSRTNSG